MTLKKRNRTQGRLPGADAPLQGTLFTTALTVRQVTSVILAVAFAAVLIALLGTGEPPLPYRRGQVAKADIKARINFSVFDEAATRRSREAASSSCPNVYQLNRASFDRALENFSAALALARPSARFEEVDPVKAAGLGVTADFFAGVKRAAATTTEQEIGFAVTQAIDAVVRRGSISEEYARFEATHAQAAGITVMDGGERRPQPKADLIKESALSESFAAALRKNISDPFLVGALTAYFQPCMKAFLAYDEIESKRAAEEAARSVTSVIQSYDKGDILVGRESLIDIPDINVLRKEQEVYLREMRPKDRLVRLSGLAILVSFLVWLFGSYVARYERRALARRTRMVVLMALAVILVAITRFFIREPLSWYLIPLSLFSLAAAVAYNPIFALAYSLFLAILVGVATGSNFSLTVSLLLGATMGVLVIGKVKSRTTPFMAGLAAGLGTFVATWGTGLLFHADYRLTLADSSCGFINGLASGVLITVMLPFIERTFNIVTDLSLLELVDLNKPVLRRLALEAAGTYNHSLFVGNLSDAAAEAIGANRLLARAGGYYHDIGKLSKPDYFVENHGTASSRHGSLSPTMSALVIISHVKDAVEMAREHRLPPPILDIIREHHGTTLVEYFYHEAVEQVGDASQVSDETFRYPGPKPHSKESAIVMLADSVESASRTVSDPTPGKLESLVVNIARKKLADGQFDECNLTLFELRQIEISLTKSLAGIFHSRIKYPGREL